MRWCEVQRKAFAALALSGPVLAAAAQTGGDDLTSLSLEQLMNEPVTSVSKKETRLNQSPAAITVVTQEDLRRMGITTLPEALRLVPGMDVARIGANQWAVSARGFNDEFATKLLVLIDGRTVYTPASGGVAWNAQDIVLEDVERIEVIRGPGATLWGANAVNGVINVITKSAQDTHGSFVSAGAGSSERGLVTARYGSQAGPDLSWRVYAKYFDDSGYGDLTRSVNEGEWHTVHGGFRVDWQPSVADNLTVQADTYDGEAGKQVSLVALMPPSVTPIDSRDDNSGADLLGRWSRNFSGDSALTLQTYVDHVDQGDGFGAEHRNTFDMDLQHRFVWGTRNDFVWGAGYRFTSIEQSPSSNIAWSPDHVGINLFNLFVQDEIALVPDRLHLTLGSKFEHNNLSGWSVEPDVRILWTPTAWQTAWAAVSRASRTPAEFELDGTLSVAALPSGQPGVPVLVAVLPNSRLVAEEITAYELGYRLAPTPQVSFDISGFFDRYVHEIVRVPFGTQVVTGPPPYLLMGWMEENSDDARTLGVEAVARWQPLPRWKLTASYTWLHMDVWPDSTAERESPRNQFQIRSYLDLPGRLELNTALYYVDSIAVPAGPTTAQIPSYTRADAGLIWKRSDSLSIGVWGQNLFDRRHLEFASPDTALLFPVTRTVVAKATWNF